MSEVIKKKHDILRRIKQGEITPEEGYQLLKNITMEMNTKPEIISRNGYDKKENQDIAVIGMAAVLPGAKDLEELWNNLIDGVDSVDELPKERWKIREDDETLKAGCRCAGTLKDVFSFDSSFFNILAQDAKFMDPQERLFLQEAWHAIEDAGYSAEKLASYKCGVFAGVMGGDYKQRTKLLGLGNSFVSARIAYLLNLNGPNMTLDTACSSSLVAIHEACQSIRNGECDMALAGGVNIITTYDSLMVTNKIGMLSKSGRCRTFDNDADGFVPSEGVGVIVLKSLEKAISEKDHIYGVIRGSAVNYDGATNGIAAPSGNAQEALELNVYENFNINPEGITYLEAHGTGTKLGDPIEISALKKAFGKFTHKRNFCYIGSLKSNIGHTLAASGVASVIKTLLCLQYKTLVPTIHVKKENEHIDFKNSPFQVITKSRNWEVEGNNPRIAAVSSFGLSGINCHMVFEEAPKVKESYKEIKESPCYLFVFSAKTKEALRELLTKYIQWLGNKNITHLPEEVAFTLMKGRTHFKFRSFIIAKDLEDLKERLQQILKQEIYLGDFMSQWLGQTGNEKFYLKEISKSYNSNQRNDFETNIFHTAKVFLTEYKDISSETLNWKDNLYTRIPLLGYPFRKVELWIPEEEKIQVKEKKNWFKLIDKIDSESCFRQCLVFNKLLAPEHELLKNHKVNQLPMFPAVGYVEMVLEALEILYPEDSVELWKIYWRTPLIVKQELAVNLELHEEDNGLAFYIITEQDNKKVIHAQGYAKKKKVTASASKIDINYIKRSLNRRAEHEKIYEYYKNIGISYGETFTGLESVWASEKEALGKFNLTKQEGYLLQPMVLDCALQTIGAMACALNIESVNTCVPFLTENIKVLNELKTSGYAHVKVIEDNRFDVDIVDETGLICVSFKNFEVKPLKQNGSKELKLKSDNIPLPIDNTYKPIWEKMDINQYKSSIIIKEEKVLVIYSDDAKELKDVLIKQLPESEVVTIRAKDSINNVINEIKEVNSIYFLGAINKKEKFDDDFVFLQETQEFGVLTLFDIIKILDEHEYFRKEVKLVVVTNNVNKVVDEDIILPYGASIYGLTGSIEKEFGAIRANVFDIDLMKYKYSNEQQAVSYENISKLLVDNYLSFKGNILAIREGNVYRNKLVPVSLIRSNNIDYRDKGVYILLGGMGGIGFALAKYLAKNYKARLVLIGRSELDEQKLQKIKEIELLGGQAIYICADASDIYSSKEAVRLAKETFGEINGAFHTTLVLRDMSLKNMKREDMNLVMAPKVKGTVVFETVLKDENLDFMMFFSSVQSYSKNAGQGNYAAASTFEDAMVQYYNAKAAYPVKVINWGYWGDVGAVCDEKANQRMKSMGIYSINEEEGMLAVHRVLNSSSTQVLFMKAEQEILKLIGVDFIEQTTKTNMINPVNEKEKKEKIENIIFNCAVNSLGIDINEVDSEQQFSELGIDSISGVEFIKALNSAFNCVLKTTVLFEKGNIKELTDFIYEEYGYRLFQREDFKENEEVILQDEDNFPQQSEYKAVKLLGPGDIEDIIIEEIKPISPKQGEVQVLVKAFSLNFGDLLCIRGLYPTMPDYPFIPGFEFSGIVLKVGQGVTRVKPGDEVIGLTSISMGAHSMIVNTVEQAIVKKSPKVTFEEACAFPVVFLTVHHIFEKVNVKPGEKILIQTAAGGTGLIAVQYALSRGMEVYATAGSKEKLDYLANMGVKHLINYQEEDFEKRILEMTKGKGVDVVINTLSGEAIQKGLNILASEGRYMEIAMTGLKTSAKLSLSALTNNQVFFSIDLRKIMLSNSDLVIKYMDVMASTLEKGEIKATIAKVFHFNNIKEAYRSLKNRENIGKIVVKTDAGYQATHKKENFLESEMLKDILKKLEDGEISTNEAKILMEVGNE